MQPELEAIIREDTRDIKAGLASIGGIPSIKRLKILTRSLHNYKPLVHDRRLLQGKHQGMVVALIDVDLIITCIELDKNTEEFATTHELVHLIRKDLPLVSLPTLYKSFRELPASALSAIYRSHAVYYRGEEPQIELKNNVNVVSLLEASNESIMDVNTVSQFKTPREYITERITSNILEYIHEEKCTTPTFAMDLFEIEEDE